MNKLSDVLHKSVINLKKITQDNQGNKFRKVKNNMDITNKLLFL